MAPRAPLPVLLVSRIFQRCQRQRQAHEKPRDRGYASTSAEEEIEAAMRRPIQVYSVRVFEGRQFAAIKDALLLGVSRILARLAGSSWAVTPALQGSPRALQSVGVRKYRSRTQIFWGHIPEEWKGKLRWDHVKLIETEYTPPYARMPSRPFVMPCRSLCGLDLKRVHVTCLLHCRIRRGYYGKLPRVAQLRAVWTIAPDLSRRFGKVRAAVFKRIALIMEASGS